MKRIKNISLVYVLQIIAVLILFFYPNYPSKAELKALSVNDVATKVSSASAANEGLQKTAALKPLLSNTANFFLPGVDAQAPLNNEFKIAADEDYKSLRKKYRIDAFSLNEIQRMHLNLPGKRIDNVSK